MLTTRIFTTGLILSSWVQSAKAQSPAIQHAEASWPTLDDLPELQQIGEMAVSADGRWVAYVSAPVFESGQSSTAGTIKFVNLRDGATHVARVPERPYNLKWSPRSGIVSFQIKANDCTEVWQYALGVRGSTARPLVSADSLGGEILDYSWSATGDAIAYLAFNDTTLRNQSDPSPMRERFMLFRDTPGDLTGPTIRVYQRDSLGAYLAVVRVGRQAVRVIRRDVVSWKGSPKIDWLRTGELAVAGIPLGASLDQLFFERSVTIIDPRSGAARPLVFDGQDAPRGPVWAPSGHRLAYLHIDRPTMDLGRPLVAYSVHVVDRRSDTGMPLLSQEADGLDNLPPIWSADERTLYIGRFERGSARLFAVDLTTGSWRAITPDTLSVSHYALSNDGKHLLVGLENANQPRELYLLNPAAGTLRLLTHEGETLSSLPLGRIDAIDWPSRDGRFTIHGFLVKPSSYDPSRPYPLIVIIHGGPSDFWTNSFMGLRFDPRFPPAQLLAASGYLVMLPNFRGDRSYGPEFQTALNGDLASGPFNDVDSGVSMLVARGLVDSASIGIYGASYGGYLAAYAITQTRRYVAAFIDDGPVNLNSLFGQQYALGTASLRERLGGTPWSRPEAYATQSPISFVNRARTPVLMRYGGRSASAADAIRHSLLAQGFEFYAGLKESNVPVEFVLHPDQGHGIADWGLYRDWVERTLAWFHRWISPRSTSP